MSAPLNLPPRTIVVGLPGTLGVAYARRHLAAGQNVVLVGTEVRDDISVRAERELKELAGRHGAWLLTPHGYAHPFRRGTIALIGTAGTAVQHLGCLLHRWGAGLSRVYSVGSRDLSPVVGGMEVFRALDEVAKDPRSEIALVVLKPFAANLRRPLARALRAIGKPTVVYVLGGDGGRRPRRLGAVEWVGSLEQAAIRATALAGLAVPDLATPLPALVPARGGAARYLRGAFSGGSCCDEAVSLLRLHGVDARTNSVVAARRIRVPSRARGHVCLDLGRGVRVNGKAHYPMADLGLMTEVLRGSAADPTVRVILFDVFLGFGSHPRPGEVLSAAIRGTKRRSGGPAWVATVVGIDSDPQGVQRQTKLLEDAGVVVAPTITRATLLAASYLSHERT